MKRLRYIQAAWVLLLAILLLWTATARLLRDSSR